VTYDLWDSQTGNIIATFETKAAALSAVREALVKQGEEYVATLLFGQEDSRGRTKPLAQGKELVSLVRSEASERAASA
jgi:hypothetical protein